MEVRFKDIEIKELSPRPLPLDWLQHTAVNRIGTHSRVTKGRILLPVAAFPPHDATETIPFGTEKRNEFRSTESSTKPMPFKSAIPQSINPTEARPQDSSVQVERSGKWVSSNSGPSNWHSLLPA